MEYVVEAPAGCTVLCCQKKAEEASRRRMEKVEVEVKVEGGSSVDAEGESKR